MERLDKAKEILKKYNQEHLLSCYDILSEENKQRLINQIISIDFDLILSLYENTKKDVDFGEAKIEPIPYVDKSKLSRDELNEYEEIGAKVIKEGKYAVVTMAGGQGTRLGYSAPKGTFEIGGGCKKSLFEALSDTIKEAIEKYNVQIPWYIMTSRENNDATVEFFETNKYFGLNKTNVIFFKQGELPMIDTQGKILLDEKGLIKEAADGHGGVFEAMSKNYILDDMKSRGIDWVFISGVDNVLAGLVDAVATGLAIKNNTKATGKSVVKANPKERVGVFCKKDGKPSVIEYTEIKEDMAEAVDNDGELLYGESHILCNLFNRSALEEIGKNKLKYHSAFKKAKYLNNEGNVIEPTSPNAFKFEAFIFDAFERLDEMSILRVKREDEFAPLKNASGVDSPETARQLYFNFIEKKNKKK